MDLKIKQVLKFIHENLEKNLTSKKLADQFNLNYTYLKDKTLPIKQIFHKVDYRHTLIMILRD